MGDQSSFQATPGIVNSPPLPNTLVEPINGGKSLDSNGTGKSEFQKSEVSDEDLVVPKIKRRHTGQRHVRQFSITSTRIANKRKSLDTARFILLQKTAIETVQKCPSIFKYAAAAVEYTEQVWNS